MAVFRFIIGVITTSAIAILAVLNRDIISFSWSPAHDSIDIPVYVVILASMATGFVFGGITVWFNAGKTRKDRRKQKKTIKILEKEIERLKKEKEEKEYVVQQSKNILCN